MRAMRLGAMLSGAALTAVILPTISAHAADLPLAPAYKAPVVAPFSWAGVFIGAHGGYGLVSESSSSGVLASSLDTRGGFGGGQIGYNSYLFGNWVVGSVLDLSAADITRSAPGLAPFAATATAKIDYFGTARVRVGYAFDHWLFYATGGTEWTHNTFDETVAATGADAFGRDQFHLGWTVGGGLEYALSRNWSVLVEYLYADLGEEKDTVPFAARTTDLTSNLVRLGVNYRFDGSAPPPAMTVPAYPLKAAPPVASPWSGTYLGAHGGYGWSRTDVTDSFVLPAETGSLDPSGGFVGIVTGYNWVLGASFLFGLESETSFGSLTQSALSSPGGLAIDAKIDWFGSERVRLGFLACPSLLLYGTGGLAWAHYKFDETAASSATLAAYDQYRVGWAGGAGLEWAFAPLWSARMEYLHSDLGTYQDLVYGFARSDGLTFGTVKLGLDWHGDILAVVFGR